MGYEIRSVLLRHVYLDNENPRHDPIDSEPEVIAHLLGKERVRKLAGDIANKGLNPLDRLGVVKHPKVDGCYISVEGNRRLCALKLLADPERAPTEAMRKVFRDLKAKATPPKQVEVALFDTRADARHWLRVRHEGELEGIGTRSWKSDQITRFNAADGSGDNPNVLSRELLQYAQHRNLINAEDRAAIKQTTLTRFLSNPVFRHTIGITSNRELRTDAPQAEFDKAIAKFLLDARTAGSPVHSRTSAKDRKAYAQSLARGGYSPSTRGAVDVRLHPDTGKMDPPPVTSQKQKRDNRSPDKRPTIIPADFQCHIKHPVHKRIYDELKMVDALEFAFAGAYLLRAFIELTTRAYLQKNSLPFKAELHVLIGNAADHLQSAGVPAKELKALRIMARERDSAYSPESLGASVHGSITPTRVELNRYWDNMAGGLRHMLDRT
jgi:hypothetical protein